MNQFLRKQGFSFLQKQRGRENTLKFRFDLRWGKKNLACLAKEFFPMLQTWGGKNNTTGCNCAQSRCFIMPEQRCMAS